MEHPEQRWKDLEKLILVAGHAIYVGQDRHSAARDASWVLRGFQMEEPRHYIEHIRLGVALAAADPHSLLLFSGGQTRLDAGPKSEAQSYWNLADQFGWWQKTGVKQRTATEEFARDSFENLLFSIARFRELTARYPQSLEIVGWEFKRERFDLHRQTIGWPDGPLHYRYHGANNPDVLNRSLDGEAITLAAFRQDPFGTEEPLSSKRNSRNPFRQTPPYPVTCPEIAALLAHKSSDGMSFEEFLPWRSFSHTE